MKRLRLVVDRLLELVFVLDAFQADRLNDLLDETGNRETQDASRTLSDASQINSSFFWKNKRRIYPHENFLAVYFKVSVFHLQLLLIN